MTREDAIFYLNEMLDTFKVCGEGYSSISLISEDAQALEIAIKALEQEPIIDKIRAEIQKYADNKATPMEMRAYYHCLQIIDKYKAESEDKE